MTNEPRMYKERKKSWNWFSGCDWNCGYCAFRKQAFRQMPKIDKNGKKRGCQLCYDYTPHAHLERLEKTPPKTKGDEFIWCCSMGDISFAKKELIDAGLEKIRVLTDRTFFFQTKDPKCYEKYDFPDNVIIGITLETNIDKGYHKISKAPLPTQRYHDFLNIDHKRKTITIEPILQFNFDPFVEMIKNINPEWVWVGYDSHNTGLPEPSLLDTHTLIKALQQFTKIKTKLLREKIQITKYRGILEYC